MNKKLIYGLCAASFLMTACDYNEDNFPGFDQEPLTDVPTPYRVRRWPHPESVWEDS